MTPDRDLWESTNCFPPYEEALTCEPDLLHLPDSFAWSKWLGYELELFDEGLRTEFDDLLGLGRFKGVLLSGAPGNGRHTTARGIISTLSKQGWYHIQLSGTRLGDDMKEIVLDVLQTTFEDTDHETRICILLEDPEQCPWIAELYGVLGWSLVCSGLADAPEIFLVVIGREDKVPEELKTMLQICRFAAPDQAAREAYLTQAVADPPLQIDDLSMQQLAELTEGFTYQSLSIMIYFLRLAHRKLILKNEPPETLSLFADDPSKFARQHLQRKTVEQLIALLRIEPETAAAPRMPAQIVMQAVPQAAAPIQMQAAPKQDLASMSMEQAESYFRAQMDNLTYDQLNAEIDRYAQNFRNSSSEAPAERERTKEPENV